VGQVGNYKGRGFYFCVEICEPAVTVFCICEVLLFCYYWFCWTDISVGFVGLIFQRIQTESPYDKSVTLAQEICKNKFPWRNT
jgi:hypothetical protein